MLFDSDTSDNGCNDGLLKYTFNWIQYNGGIKYEVNYPYKGNKQTCKSSSSKNADFKVTWYKKIGSAYLTWSDVDEDNIKEFLYENGPLAISLNADPL